MTPSISLDHTTPAVVPESSETPAAFTPTNELFSLAGRTVMITGGGRGLGMCLSTAVLEAGGDVACLDLLPEPSEEEWTAVQKTAKQRGLQATYTQCDITNEENTKKVLEDIAAEGIRRNKPLRGAITCAGIQQMVPALDYPIDGYRKMLDVK
jgi:NAD(P)-dependent dehydrogenase (short-subunit alcohol dehydrogenase family)